MCWSCGCLDGSDDHGDARAITTLLLQGAADFSTIELADVVDNITKTWKKVGDQLAKAAGDDSLVACRVVKAAEERRYTLGVAYPAMKADVNRAADGYRDFVAPEVLEKTAWSWLAKYRDVNLHHREATSGHFTPTESYIYRGPDWQVRSPVDGKPYVIKAGDWLLGGIWDDLGWAQVKAGMVNGWSPEGGAARAVPSAERLAQLRS